MKSKNVRIFGSILETRNYGMFKTISSNRNINPLNYAKLLRSMKEEQLIIPICVNEKYEVIDGQHRLKVCEELGLKVYYYVLRGYSTAQMKRANLVSANWKKDDFLNAYVNENSETYVEFLEIKESYNVTTTDLIKIISKIQNKSIANLNLDFEEGNLTLTEGEKNKVIKFLTALEDFNYFKEYKRAKFLSAFLDLYTFEAYEHAQMQARIKTRGEALKSQATKDDYVAILANKIYSFGTTKNNIYYDLNRQRLYQLKQK